MVVKCPECGEKDLRVSFRQGKHQCIVHEEFEDPSKNRERGVRNYDEVRKSNKSRQNESMNLSQDQGNSSVFLTGPVTQAQIRIVKDEIQNIQNLITVDIFQMIDTFSKALTEKEGEVADLRKEFA